MNLLYFLIDFLVYTDQLDTSKGEEDKNNICQSSTFAFVSWTAP